MMAAAMSKTPVLRDKLFLLGKKTFGLGNHCPSRAFETTSVLLKATGDARVRSSSNSVSTSTSTNADYVTPASAAPTSTTSSSASDRLGHIMQMYEDLVGLTEVKTAQDHVVEAERNFLKVQEDRRTLQQEISEIQADVRSVATELEKTHRTDPCYIDLVKKEHGILVKEKDMTTKLKTLDRCERDLFSLLSMYVRESHEKERARAERTKYWSVIGSIIGAIIGITGSTINNHRRLKELRSIVTESGENSAEYKAIADRVLSSLSTYPVLHTVGGNGDNNNNNNNASLNQSSEINEMQSEIFKFKQWTETLHNDLNVRTSEILSSLVEVKKLVAIKQSSDSGESPDVVYVGPEIKSMLRETEMRVDHNAQKNLVISLSVMGGIFTVGLSLLAYIFKSS